MVKDPALEFPYTVAYYSRDNSFVVSRQYFKGKNEKGINSYGREILYDGRSQEMKDAWTKQKIKIPSISKHDADFTLGEADGTAEGDKAAVRDGIFHFLFEEPERLGIK